MSEPFIDVKSCMSCGNPEPEKQCPKCKAIKIYYCNKECQTNDWKRHKSECGVIKEDAYREKCPAIRIHNFFVRISSGAKMLYLRDLNNKEYVWKGVIDGEETFEIKIGWDMYRVRDVLLELARTGPIDFEKQEKITREYKLNVKREEGKPKHDYDLRGNNEQPFIFV